MGGGVIWKNIRQVCGEKVGDVQVYYRPLHGISIDEEIIPSLIDELPALAVLASTAEGVTTVMGAQELRVKETDRISAICKNLNSMGANIIEKRDGFIISSPNILYSTNIKSYGDHRIAMAFIIAGICAGNYNKIDDIKCIDNSFPEFIKVLNTIIK